MPTSFLMVAALFTPAWAGDWEATKVKTVEGDALLVEKKGRARYRLSIEAADPSDGIRCGWFFATKTYMQRAPLALHFKTAASRAASKDNHGEVVSFSESLSAYTDAGVGLTPGYCAIGVTATPGAVTLMFANTGKINGRTATVSADEAARLGAWLME